ncbi:hypothetical protein R3P38DRAFT_2888026, partial [Favolaschia claudopus]
MVSAGSLNLDVLELVFSYLSGTDLTAIARVNRFFFAGAIPHLYSILPYRLSHAKRYPSLASPFSVIYSHPWLAVHVRHIDIRSIPVVKSQINTKFAIECTRALDMCPNISSFRCTVNALPPFLGSLAKKDRLHDLWICANLTTDQSAKLIKLAKIRTLTLDLASWNILSLLPQWATTLRDHLRVLTLYMTNELSETMLEKVLAELPGLIGLHVIQCAKVHHVAILAQVSHTPLLESLSFTTSEDARDLLNPPPQLTSLLHLSIDLRFTPMAPMQNPSPNTISAILTHINHSSPRLESFVLKYPSRQYGVQNSLIQQIIGAYAPSLKNLSFIDCAVGTTDSLTALCRACAKLERLEVWIPVDDLVIFAISIAQSKSLRTLVDVNSHTHAPRSTLRQGGVYTLMSKVESLQEVVTDTETWKRTKDLDDSEDEDEEDFTVTSERHSSHGGKGKNANHWFMPRE